MNVTRREMLMLLATMPVAASMPVAAWAAPYQKPAQEVSTWQVTWADAKRNRDVPIKIYYPAKLAAPAPVIIFSHGLGGSREGYEYVGRYWAGQGYISVHLQHIGSDSGVWQGQQGQGQAATMESLRGAANIRNAVARPRDVSFVLDKLTAANAGTDNQTAGFPLRGKLDLNRIGMAGHSFGSNTTLLISGMKMPLLNEPLADPRIKASIAMSSPKPGSQNYELIYGGIHIPMLHMTGTKDLSPVDMPGMTAIDRRLPFDHIKGNDAYLLTFKDGDHMVFSGQRWRGGPVASDARNHVLIQQCTTAFWDAYLRDDQTALKWLRTDFAGELKDSGTWEQKAK